MEQQIPVVVDAAPAAHVDIHRRSAKRLDHGAWRGVIQNAVVVCHEIEKQGEALVHVVVVADADSNIDTPRGVTGIISFRP